MLEQNRPIHEFTGVARFHAAGYTGSRARAATGEVLVPEDWDGPGHVETLVQDGKKSTGSHSRMTASVFFEVAPDAILYRASNNVGRNSDGTYNFVLYDTLMPEMERLGITQMFTSRSTSAPGGNERARAEQFVEENDWFIPFWSAGNDGDDKANGKLKLAGNVGVAAYSVVNGKAVPKHYSSESEYVDFAAPTDIKYRDGSQIRSGTGTSAAAPYLCGMAALVQDFFIDRTGHPLKREALLRFFADHCMDIGDPGQDDKTGAGAVILPDPSEIDMGKYTDVKQEEVSDVATYHTLGDVPTSYRPTIRKLMEAGVLQGHSDPDPDSLEDNVLDVDETYCRVMTTLDRMGVLPC